MKPLETRGGQSAEQFLARLTTNFGIVSQFAQKETMPPPYIPPSDALAIKDRYLQESTAFAQSCLRMFEDRHVAQLIMARIEFPQNRIFSSHFRSTNVYREGESGTQEVRFEEVGEPKKPKLIFTITTGRMTVGRQENRAAFKVAVNKIYPPQPETPWQLEEIDMAKTAYFQFRAQRGLATTDLTNNPDLFRHFLLWLDRRLENVTQYIKSLSMTTEQKRELNESIALFQEANALARKALGKTPPPKSYQI